MADMEFLERASATGLRLPGTWRRVQLYSDIAERCRCCLEDRGSDFLEKAWINGRWSVCMVKVTPCKKCLKCLTDEYTARSSLSKVEYRDSADDSFLLKKANGRG